MLIARLKKTTRPDGTPFLQGEMLAAVEPGWVIYLVKAAEDTTYELRCVEPRKIDSRPETLLAFDIPTV